MSGLERDLEERRVRLPTVTKGLLLAVFALGLGLRLWGLDRQVMGGDELHAVRAALLLDLPTILTTYLPADPCIPLTALYHLWIGLGARLSETVLRLPVLTSGLVFLVAIPWIVARAVGYRAALVFVALASLSPSLVLYSRIVRSYMPVVLLGTLAAAAFWVWWRTGRHRWAVAYVLAAAVAVWFHLGAGPFVTAPFLFAAGDKILDAFRGKPRATQPGWGALIAVGAAVVLALLSFLVPARESLVELLAEKRIDQTVPEERLRDVFALAAGSRYGWVVGIFWLLALTGLGHLLHRRRALGLYGLVLGVGQVAGIFLLSPLGLANPLILFRYLLVALPVVLLWVAVAVAGLESMNGEVSGSEAGDGGGSDRRFLLRRDWLRPVAAVLLALGLLLSGPFLDEAFVYGSFAHHNDFVNFVEPRPRLAAGAIPGIYPRLSGSARGPDRFGPGPVLEYPWSPVWSYNRALPLYQLLHEREVLVAPAVDFFLDPRLDFANAVPPDRSAFLASRARYLVLHLRPAAEEDRLAMPPGARGVFPFREPERRRLATMGRRMSYWLEEGWGAPVYEDRWVRVWDLASLRSSGSRSENR